MTSLSLYAIRAAASFPSTWAERRASWVSTMSLPSTSTSSCRSGGREGGGRVTSPERAVGPCGTDVEITVHGERKSARAELMSDPSEVASVYADLIDEMGLEDASRRLGIKVNVSHEPTV